MSVYVGIDLHRKRPQVAVIDQDGEALAIRNVPNGVKPILSVIGGLPAGTPAAIGAAFGWGWLVELLEGYGFVGRVNGSHHIMHHPDGRRTTVPVHAGRDIRPGTLRSILRDAGLTVDELPRLL